jgi:hypothetical protein
VKIKFKSYGGISVNHKNYRCPVCGQLVECKKYREHVNKHAVQITHTPTEDVITQLEPGEKRKRHIRRISKHAREWLWGEKNIDIRETVTELVQIIEQMTKKAE